MCRAVVYIFAGIAKLLLVGSIFCCCSTCCSLDICGFKVRPAKTAEKTTLVFRFRKLWQTGLVISLAWPPSPGGWSTGQGEIQTNKKNFNFSLTHSSTAKHCLDQRSWLSSEKQDPGWLLPRWWRPQPRLLVIFCSAFLSSKFLPNLLFLNIYNFWTSLTCVKPVEN